MASPRFRARAGRGEAAIAFASSSVIGPSDCMAGERRRAVFLFLAISASSKWVQQLFYRRDLLVAQLLDQLIAAGLVESLSTGNAVKIALRVIVKWAIQGAA